MIPINYAAVFTATLVSYILGALWYGPLFGKKWMKLSGFTKESLKDMPLTPLKAMALGFVNTVVVAYFLWMFVIVSSASTWVHALTLAFWIWLGFVVTTLASGPLWEGKSFKLFFFNCAQQLISYSLMALVLTWWVRPL